MNVDVVMRGQAFALTIEEAEELWTQIQEPVIAARIARREAEEAAAREAGQVWTAIYSRFHTLREEECLSLDEAIGLLAAGAYRSELVQVGVRLPDGQMLDGPELDQRIRRHMGLTP